MVIEFEAPIYMPIPNLIMENVLNFISSKSVLSVIFLLHIIIWKIKIRRMAKRSSMIRRFLLPKLIKKQRNMFPRNAPIVINEVKIIISFALSQFVPVNSNNAFLLYIF